MKSDRGTYSDEGILIELTEIKYRISRGFFKFCSKEDFAFHQETMLQGFKNVLEFNK